MRRTFVTLCTAVACLAAHAAVSTERQGEIPIPCEPSGELEVSAKVVGLEDQGARERVMIDLKIHSLVAQGDDSLRVTGVATAATARVETPAREVALRNREPKKVRYVFDLEKGVDHDVRFEVRSLRDPSRRTEAYVKVALDPRTRPENSGDVLQFRARMQGR